MPRNRTNDLEANELVNTAEEMNRKAMYPQMRMWLEATNAIQNKLPVTDPYSPNITVGRLAADTETIVARDVQSLLGNSPYFPYSPSAKTDPMAQIWASGITDLVDYFTQRGSLYTKFSDMYRMCRPLGLGYLEPRWAMWPVSIYQKKMEKDALGRIVGLSESYEESMEEGLEFRVIDPPCVRPHPHGNSLDEKANICIVELVHTNEIKRLLETEGSGYKAPEGIDEKAMFSGSSGFSDINSELRRSGDVMSSDVMKDIQVLIRYYSEDRWIHTLNRQHVLMDTENHNKNMPRFKKPIAMFRNMSHIGPDRFWPIGDYEYMMDLYWLGDMWLNLYAKAAQMSAAQWIMFNPDMGIRSEDLIASAGARIPVQGGNFDQAIRSIKVAEPPREYLEFYHETSTITDNRRHLNDYVAGREPSRKETATAVNQLSSSGMAHLEQSITYVEQGGLTELAYLTAKEVAANASDQQRVEILGWERAMQISTADPDAIPGGYSLEFKGSDRVQREQERKQKALEFYNLFRPQQTVKQPWMLDRLTAEVLDIYTHEQLDAMGLTQESQMATQPPEQQAMPALGGGSPAAPQ